MSLLAIRLFTLTILVFLPAACVWWIVSRPRGQFSLRSLFVLVTTIAFAAAFHAWANRSGFYYVLADPNAVAADGIPEEHFFPFP